MVCLHCGAENPDYVLYCGSCGRPIRGSDEPTSAPGTEGVPPPEEPAPPPEILARNEALSLPVSKLTMAAIAAGVAVVLVLTAFALHVYWYERILNPGHDFEESMELFEIAKYATYTRLFGEVSALIGAVLVVQSLMIGGPGSASAVMKRIRLKSLLWLGIAMAVFIGITTSVMVYVSEAEPELSDTAADVLSRAMAYPLVFAFVLGTVALFIVTVALRNASIGSKTSTLASPPKTQ
ncbi:MAG: zinc-ribbon domain-containing protein [Thermoplasmata archaeon]|nr:zinc-ribbon domain-containing protein [Thermoplasmata archaeon]